MTNPGLKRHLCVLLVIVATAVQAFGLAGAAARSAAPGAPATVTYLPLVVQAAPPACALNQQEQQLATLLINDPDQHHTSLTCHPILAQVARERAQDMVNRHYFSHTNPDGHGANYLVVQAGYVLPGMYSSAPDGNNIESIAAGYPAASATWTGWMNSPGHRAHLLGETQFYAEQREYGIGYASGGDYHYYWVVIIAKPGP
ncbi:MAG TPA: CAP domain-containing protein [Roseiflexaceae bacterium]|nr:CAP domain-containing protein [Roseiflexaceae bacterium]